MDHFKARRSLSRLTTGTAKPVVVGTQVSLTVNFSDPAGASDNPYAVQIYWDCTSTTSGLDCPSASSTTTPATITPGSTSGSVTATKTYSSAGVYIIKVIVTDKDNRQSVEYIHRYFVVYDPNGGFVTGGGWIISPAGACVAGMVPGLCNGSPAGGKANFGFVSKYAKGSQTVVDGETEFQFKDGNINFHSTAYAATSLVISGPMAQYKGTGTINGTGNYNFIVTARDGNVAGGGGSDGFRIKITTMVNGVEAVVYDNRPGTANDMTSANTTTLSGGSVTIHK
jgi:hypothetical protein